MNATRTFCRNFARVQRLYYRLRPLNFHLFFTYFKRHSTIFDIRLKLNAANDYSIPFLLPCQEFLARDSGKALARDSGKAYLEVSVARVDHFSKSYAGFSFTPAKI